MVGAILVLGPSTWRDNPPTSAIVEPPLSTRKRLARSINRIGGEAHLMETIRRTPDETHTRLFFRIIEQMDIQTFFLYWPLGARLLGLEKEIGHLTGWLEDGALHGEQVVILTERGHLKDEQAQGVMSLNEPGNRTRWHEDLWAYGASLRVWDNDHSLRFHVVGAVMEHRRRDRRDWFPGY